MAVNVNIQNELAIIKQDAMLVRNAVILLENEKESLRKAIRKLKLENGRMKLKIKTLNEKVGKLTNEKLVDVDDGKAPESEYDYDDLNRDFYLIGGIHDPLSLRFEVTIRDKEGIEHKSAERFYWYKMAEKFGDEECKKKLMQAPNVQTAEEAVKNIQKFDSKVWDEVKHDIWEEGQRLKLDQVRWICNLLVLTKTTYLAVASEDKFFGTGWRKNRDESNKPVFWDGENEGGKILMNLRHELKKTHQFNGPQEEEETNTKLREMMRYVWRRIDPTKRNMALGGRGLSSGGLRGVGRIGGGGGGGNRSGGKGQRQ
uniref:NADAR domain-containing protein n=1 Tax=Meloidogyne incognita TaxID=6306 RepID=A0A914KKD6_MELIC